MEIKAWLSKQTGRFNNDLFSFSILRVPLCINLNDVQTASLGSFQLHRDGRHRLSRAHPTELVQEMGGREVPGICLSDIRIFAGTFVSPAGNTNAASSME